MAWAAATPSGATSNVIGVIRPTAIQLMKPVESGGRLARPTRPKQTGDRDQHATPIVTVGIRRRNAMLPPTWQLCHETVMLFNQFGTARGLPAT